MSPLDDSLHPRHVPAAKLSTLVAGQCVVRHGDTEVTGITFDSRAVTPGDAYVALPGAKVHGAQFAEAAVASGAVAVLTDEAGSQMFQVDVPVVVCESPRTVMGEVAARLYGHPAWAMSTFAVTGTNGKTTTVAFLAAALKGVRQHVGTIGTLGFSIDDEMLQTSRTTVTTPESCDLQALLRVMADRGVDGVAMEVSSHALVLDRTAGLKFDVAGFTNLGQDHLDFHHTLEEYFEAKARLFTPQAASQAVITVDDARGRSLVQRARYHGMMVASVGFDVTADYRIISWRPLGSGSEFVLTHRDQTTHARIGLPGLYNVRNAALALAMVIEAGVPAAAALPGLAAARVPGRMEPVDLEGPAPVVYVDFAHTPQAIESGLEALSAHADGLAARIAEDRAGQIARADAAPDVEPTSADALEDPRIIVVIGAGGDRDATKRPLMGQAAARGADVVIITDDNPRSEDPAQIRQAVMVGAREVASDPESGRGQVQVIDGGKRRDAIHEALRIARPGDIVVVMGKGHEHTQIVSDQVIDFDDRAVVREQWQVLHPGGQE